MSSIHSLSSLTKWWPICGTAPFPTQLQAQNSFRSSVSITCLANLRTCWYYILLLKTIYLTNKWHLNVSSWRSSTQVQDTSASIGEAQAEDSDTSSDEYTPGQFVIIKYEGKPYVGQIVTINKEGLEINCMNQIGKKWFFSGQRGETAFSMKRRKLSAA